MILHRVVFQAQMNKANEVVAAVKKGYAGLSEEQLSALQPRVLTDLSGSFDTVIIETTHESLGAYEAFRKAMFAEMAERESPSPIPGLVKGGRNEFYTIE